jgi:uncharacterized protein (DUF58 family)
VRRNTGLRLKRAAATIAAGVGGILIGLAFGTMPLLVVGLALAALGATAIAWTLLTARGVTVRRRLYGERVVEGEPLEARLQLKGGWLGLPLGEIEEPLAGAPMRVPRGRAADIKLLTHFQRRGLRTLEPPSLSVHDPLELAQARCISSQPPQEVLVLPRTEPVRYLHDGAYALGLAQTRADVLAAIEIDGLRQYVPGTPASRIHWPALARGAGLLERKLRVAGDTVPLVVLDARGPEPVGPALRHLDAAVRAAASLTLELARAGGCRLLLSGARRAQEISRDLLGWPVAHARLAVVDGGRHARAPAPGAMQGALGPLIYVVAQRLERVPGALLTGQGRPAVLVVPDGLADSAPGRAVFAVAGSTGFVIGIRALARERPEVAMAAIAGNGRRGRR